MFVKNLTGKSPLSLAVLILLATCLPGAANASLRCGNSLITQQDAAINVLQSCGEPSYRSLRFVPGTNIVDKELWFYNPGPRRLLQIVHIRAGRVRRVETGGRGFRQLQSCQAQDIEEGWSDFELLGRCGEPAVRATFWGPSSANEYGYAFGSGGIRYRRRFEPALANTVWVEEWQYNFGANQLIRLVRLENGVVRQIETGGYGFGR